MSTTPLGNLEFSLSCQKCGSNELTIPDEATDDSPVTCSTCGAELTTWGKAQAAVHEAATKKFKEDLSNRLSKTLNGSGGVTFKKFK